MKEPNETLEYQDLQIKLFEENDHGIASSSNWWAYQKVYLNNNEHQPNSQMGVQVLQENQLLADCLVGAEGGATGVHPGSVVVSEDRLVICCADTVFALGLPELQLLWKQVADSATCFGVYRLEDDYVVHGELQITRLSKDGSIIWQYSGSDIWTTPDAVDVFSIHDGYLLVTDWNYDRHKLDFDGQLVELNNIKT